MKAKYIIPEVNTNGLVARCKIWSDGAGIISVFDYSMNGYTASRVGTANYKEYPGQHLDGTDEYLKFGGGPASVSTVLMWVKPDSITLRTDYPIDLNGTDYLTIVNGTLTKTGFAGGTAVLYTDGVAASTTVTTRWHLIGITDTVAKNASGLDIGRVGANYFDGLVGETLLYNKVLNEGEIKNIYNVTRWRYGV